MYDIAAGLTSQLVDVFIQDSSVTTGAGLTGLVFNSSGLTCYYKRQGQATWTAVALATMTQGTWATRGFVEGDATNAKGMYEFGIPDAAIATGAGVHWVDFIFQGATNMAPCPIRIVLRGQANELPIVGSAMTLTSTYDFAKGTAAVTEAYNADGAAPTPVQALMLILQRVTEFSISGTTVTIKKLDGSTTAATLTLDSNTAPTSSTRAS